jgi:hypothetical protein
MQNFLIIILLIVILYYLIQDRNENRRLVEKSHDDPNNQDKNNFINVNMKDICAGVNSTSNDHTDNQASNNAVDVSNSKTTANGPTPALDLDACLNLKPEELKPLYSYTENDRFFLAGKSDTRSMDEKLMEKMIDQGAQAQQSMINRSLWTVDSFRPYIEEDLEETANNAAWWENSELQNEF